MNTQHYICQHCQREYIPKRRFVQKYCSDSCRSNAHQRRKKLSKKELPTKKEDSKNKTKIDKVSIAGVTNTMLGNLATDGLKGIFTANDKKPATKGDIKLLLDKLERYHKIEGLTPRLDGAVAYFDLVTKRIVYFNEPFD